MASYGKVDAFSLQNGYLANIVTENLRTVDQFTFGGLIPWIDLGTQSQYLQDQVSSYGSTAPTGLAASADITYSNAIITKTQVPLKNIAVGAQMPIQFMNDPKQLATQIAKKAYVLGRTLATTLAGTGVATDTNIAGIGSQSGTTPDAYTLTGGTVGGSTSGGISVAQIRKLITNVSSVPNNQKVLVMPSRTYVSLLSAIEALSWNIQTTDVGLGAPVPMFDGIVPILINDFMPIIMTEAGAVGAASRVYCLGLNQDVGFAGIYGSGGDTFANQDLNAWGGAIRYRLVDDADSTQINLQLWAHVNFMFQEPTAFSQIVGVSN